MTSLLTPSQALQPIAAGHVIAYPTEAVYGLGCDPQNGDAVQAVLNLKSRDANKGFILIAVSIDQLSDYIQTPTEAERRRLNRAWPGPVTFVVRAKPELPVLLTGGRDTLAVRVTSHPVVAELCTRCGHPLVSTSANLSGAPELTDADAVMNAFGDAIAGVVDGTLGNLHAPTPIYSLASGEQLR